MAITATSLTVKKGFCVSAYSADASGCEELVAAVSGKQIKVRSVFLNSEAQITLQIGAGETGGAVTANVLGPLTMLQDGSVGPINFNPPIELAANTALVVDASGAGNVCIIVQGDIE